MPSTRREFLDRLAGGTTALAGLAALSPALALAGPAPAAVGAGRGEWDVSWVRRLTGRHKAVFDVAEVESGYGVWRASIWARQYQEVLHAPARELSPVLVIRHNAIVLAMQQPFWDEYAIGKAKQATHPVTLEPTDRNPALLGARDGVPAPFAGLSLPDFLDRGGVALACNLALQFCVRLVQARRGVSAEEAERRARASLVPGVVLQPSGVFGAVLAQEAGCSYVRAS